MVIFLGRDSSPIFHSAFFNGAVTRNCRNRDQRRQIHEGRITTTPASQRPHPQTLLAWWKILKILNWVQYIEHIGNRQIDIVLFWSSWFVILSLSAPNDSAGVGTAWHRPLQRHTDAARSYKLQQAATSCDNPWVSVWFQPCFGNF